MANEVGLRSYVGFQQMAVPDEYLSSQAPRSFAGQLVQRVIQSSTGTIGPNSRMVFSIPSGENAYIKPGSAYISCLITVTSDNAANAPSFRKSRLGNAVFRAAQLTANGVLVQRTDNVNDVNFLLYNHATSPNFYNSDAIVLEGQSFAAGLTSSLQVFLPVPLGCLNSQAIPLWALPNNNILLELETESIAGCMKSSVGYNVTNIQFSNAQLVFESLQVDASMVQMLKEEMSASQIPYVIPFQEVRVFQQSGAASNNVILGVNLSSIDAICVVQRPTPALASDQETYTAPTGTVKFDCYTDGKKINNYVRDSGLKCFPDLNLALSKLYDVTCVSTTYGLNMSRADYDGGASIVFAAGQNLRKTYSKAVVLGGTPANQVQVDLSGFTAANLLIMVFHDSLWNIDVASGSVTMLR